MEKISGFFGDYRFLSNYHFQPVEYDGVVYPTNEHAYQAAKTNDLKQRKEIAEALTPKEAKKLGQKVTMIANWDDIKINVMVLLTRQKFSHAPLQDLLLATGDAELIEENTWNDTYWGVCNGVGTNHLGKVLMAVRASLRE